MQVQFSSVTHSCPTLCDPLDCSPLGSSVGEGDGTPLQYSCLENPMDGGAWWAAVHEVSKSQTQLSDFTCTFPLSGIGEGNGNPLQCSCLENPRDGGAWWAAVYGVAQSRTRLKRLSSSSSLPIPKNLEGCKFLPARVDMVPVGQCFCPQFRNMPGTW